MGNMGGNFERYFILEGEEDLSLEYFETFFTVRRDRDKVKKFQVFLDEFFNWTRVVKKYRRIVKRKLIRLFLHLANFEFEIKSRKIVLEWWNIYESKKKRKMLGIWVNFQFWGRIVESWKENWSNKNPEFSCEINSRKIVLEW